MFRMQTTYTLSAAICVGPGKALGSIFWAPEREEGLLWAFFERPPDAYSLKVERVACLDAPISVMVDSEGKPVGLRHLCFQPGLLEASLRFAGGMSGP